MRTAYPAPDTPTSSGRETPEPTAVGTVRCAEPPLGGEGRVPRVLLALAMACGLAGCGPAVSTPMTASEMAKAGTGDALVTYLSQPGATSAVCDRKGTGPRFRGSRPDDFARLARGLIDGDVRPVLWQRCAMLLLESAKPEAASSLLDALAHGYRELLGSGSIEGDADEQARLLALHRTILLRSRGTAPHADAVAEDVVALREALASGALGPYASRHGRELLTSIDLERGIWRGAPLTTATLDELQAKGDEAMLRRIALRVPDRKLEREARRRIVRLHIASSPSKEVRDHADEVESRVLETGHNAIDLDATTPVAAWLDEARARVSGVLVRQDLQRQTATLLAYEGDEPGASLIPSINFRGALFVRVEGLGEPVTLCAPPDALDVTPCVPAAELRPKVPVVYVDEEGLLHFVERLTIRDAMRLVYNTPNLPLPFEIRGRELLTIEWPLVFERPAPLVFSAPATGRGPDLRVTLERRYGPRLLFEVVAPQGTYAGVVEAKDYDSFLIASRGGPGVAGTRGTDGATGTPGMAGMSASCPSSPAGNGGNGGPGGNGTAGGPGGPGGDGGAVMVQVACVTGQCDRVTSVARKMVRSEGGPGGPGGEGGRGGAGGPGGPGGSGTSCFDSAGHSTYLSGGVPGSNGSQGSPGARGADGPSGAPGPTEIRVAQ